MTYDRIVIVGKSGSGKTTLAGQLSALFGAKHVELDALYWQSDWIQTPEPAFQAAAASALPTTGRWVADGSYAELREIAWRRADTLVWLDFPLWLTLWRLLWRILARWYWATELWNGNREKLSDQFTLCTDKNLFYFAMDAHARDRQQYPAMLSDKFAHLNVLRFQHPRELDRWLSGMGHSMT